MFPTRVAAIFDLYCKKMKQTSFVINKKTATNNIMRAVMIQTILQSLETLAIGVQEADFLLMYATLGHPDDADYRDA